MRSFMRFAAVAIALSIMASNSALAQDARISKRPKGHAEVPSSSIEKPGDRGKRVHTNVRLFIADEKITPADGGGSSGNYYYETPASLACVYKLVPSVGGCNPVVAKNNAMGGSKAIAIVDAFDDSFAAYELNYFSSAFGLPSADFEVVYASGVQPPPAPFGWWIEESLDIEWAHAMAPNAKIYLVEAASDNNSDLFAAVKVASNLVAAAGGGEVSMSWGGSEWSGEKAYDSLFTTPGVVYFAAAGDGPGPIHPSVSRNVVAVGGITQRRDAVTGNLIALDAWLDGGGGLSLYEPRPSYQAGIASIVGNSRGVPDVAADADLYTGVWVYSAPGGWPGWYIAGGTSVATPVWAGIVNQAGKFAPSSNAELTTIYNNLGVSTNFKDIRQGYCGYYAGDAAITGWDFCTGVGSPLGLLGK